MSHKDLPPRAEEDLCGYISSEFCFLFTASTYQHLENVHRVHFVYTRTLSEPLYSFRSWSLRVVSSDVFRPFEQIQFTNLDNHCRYLPPTVVSQRPILIDDFFKKIAFPNFPNFYELSFDGNLTSCLPVYNYNRLDHSPFFQQKEKKRINK